MPEKPQQAPPPQQDPPRPPDDPGPLRMVDVIKGGHGKGDHSVQSKSGDRRGSGEVRDSKE